MIRLAVRIVYPLTLAVAVAVWSKGYAAVGDGFSAGALAGLGATAQFVCLGHDEARRNTGARWAWALLVGGLLLVLAVTMAPTLAGVAPVTHLPAPGQEVVTLGVLEFHSALIFDLGVALLVYGGLVTTFDRLFPPLRGEPS